MKKAMIVICIAAFGILTCTAAPPASAAELPKIITFTSYPVGSLAYTITSGFREAIEKDTPMKARVEPYDTDVARVMPLRNKESELSILTGATGTCVSYGIAEFGGKAWGPQPLRQVWRGQTLYLSMVTRGNSGIQHPRDLKGKRIPDVPGWPAGMLSIEGTMAFGNVTWSDVQKIPVSGYVDQLKAVMEGKVDAGWAATVTPTIKELDAGPHKAAWVMLPKEDKAGWERLQKLAPFVTPGVCKSAPGLAQGQTMEIGQYPYSLWAYDHASPDMVYEVVKSLHKSHDQLKKMHKSLEEWTLQQAVTDPSPVPYHQGAVKYFKEAGVWTPEMEQWQAKQLENFKIRAAAAKK
jgi:TRAP transporter TAXI family solute receptor